MENDEFIWEDAFVVARPIPWSAVTLLTPTGQQAPLNTKDLAASEGFLMYYKTRAEAESANPGVDIWAVQNRRRKS